jgi:MoaA/NifB/PqqE/SkfB family radical SAM enzyme
MCGIWKNNASESKVSELSLKDLDQILADKLFRKVEYVNINGGELSLRRDLPEVIQTAVNRLPALRKISLSSNGLITDQLLKQVEQIKQICVQANIAFSISISVHGLYEVEDKIFGVKGTFEKQLKTITALQEIASDGNLSLGLYSVIMNENAMNLRQLLEWCEEKHLTIRFSLVEMRDRFNNADMEDTCEIDAKNKATIFEFLNDLSHDKGLYKPHTYVYDYLADLLQYNRQRTMSCDYALGGVIVGSHGELFYCPHDDTIGNCRDKSAYEIFYDQNNLGHRRNSLIPNKCLHCPPRNFGYLAIQVDIFKYLKFLIGRN